MTLISQSAGYLNFYNTVALLTKEYAPADYLGFYANTTDLGPVVSDGVNWIGITKATSLAYLPPGSGAAATTVAAKLAQTVSVLDFGADPTGVADSTAPINNAITYASIKGGVVYFPGGTYTHSGSIMQASGVVLSGYGATLSYSGSGVQVTSPTSGVLNNSGMIGISFNAGSNSTKILEIFSPYSCGYVDVQVNSVSTTNIALDILTNTTGGVNGAGNRNPAYNFFNNFLQQGTCGTGLRCTGSAVGPSPVTLNTWISFNVQSCAVCGINLVQWCDSNYFAGVTRIGVNGNNGVGVAFNTGSPTTNVGVYSINFDHLAVDTFAGPTGRIGVLMNFTKLCKINYYFNDPAAEGGPFVTTANTQSYNVLHQIAGTGSLIQRSQLTAIGGADQPLIGFGTGGDISNQTVLLQVGVNRTGSGISGITFVGDTTFTAYGAEFLRQAGANGNSNFNHRGTGGIILQSVDAGGFCEIVDSTGANSFICNNTGVGVFGVVAPRSTGWGTPVGGAVIPNYNITDAGGANSNTNKTVAQILAVLKAFGWMGS